MSDSYDPFMSAKRQLEELFSPTQTSTPTNANKMTTNTMNRTYNAPTSSSLARSYPNSTNLNAIKSSFKRTSSLRMPKTTASLKQKPNTLFLPHKPTIQRGISIDDGPISSNFLKSSEFDELPIKSACVNPSNKSVASNTGKAYPQPPASPLKPIVMRDPNSVLRRKEMKLDLRRPANLTGVAGTDLSKTDSLAVFLKYEHDLSLSPTLTEKEIKDKSNSFNKRFSNSDKSPTQERTPATSENAQIFVFPEQPQQQPQQAQQPQLQPHHKQQHMTHHQQQIIDPKLINLCDNLPINITKLSDTDTNSSDSTDTTTTSEFNRNTELLKNMLNEQSGSNRSSGIGSESSRRFKRQLKLSKDNFLYDTDVDSDQCDMVKTPTETTMTTPANHIVAENNNNNSKPSGKTVVSSTDKLFENFDLDEFISSFEDDENYPIFKDYKELFLNQNSSSTRSPSATKEKDQQNDDPKNAMNNNNNNNETEENNNHNKNRRNNVASHPNPKQHQNENDEQNELSLLIKEIAQSNLDDQKEQQRRKELVANSPKKFDELDKAESDLLKSVQELNLMCETTPPLTMYPADSDDTSSVDSFTITSSTGGKTAGSKFGADSAYGRYLFIPLP